MITTTLKRIREHSPCEDGWTNLLAGLGKTSADDAALPFATILEINGLDDAHWCCRAEPQYAKEWRLLMVAYARRVEHLSTHPSVKNAIDVAERYANGKATDKELSAARAAVWAVRAAESASRDAAMVAGDTARADAGDEIWFAARSARAALCNAARAAPMAAVAAWEDERKWQEQEFLRCVTETGASDGYRCADEIERLREVLGMWLRYSKSDYDDHAQMIIDWSEAKAATKAALKEKE